MADKGWNSEDRITYLGWGDKGPGYSIWFERWNWHNKERCDKQCFHAHTPDLDKIPETVQKAADLALQAWEEYPNCPPVQGGDGKLQPNSEYFQKFWNGESST